MAREVAIGKQKFPEIREGGYFYVDKTGFVRDWWRSGDDATLVCRPRRFGKTLALSTVECFFSLDYAGRGEELFGGLEAWGDPEMRDLQGAFPVVALSFADCKRPALDAAIADMKRALRGAVEAHPYLRDSEAISRNDRAFLDRVSDDMDDVTATTCLKQLCSMLERHHGVKPIVLLDEYDAPLQEAWLHGYWDGMSAFVRSLFNSTFKTNPAMARGLITGIARVASESIFSDLNNLAVITTTTPQYETDFGFTEGEVEQALAEFGMPERLGDVREWYDGFTFGDVAGVYNPWSITSCLQWRRLEPYWANTSSNNLVSSLVRRSSPLFKEDFEVLMAGGSVRKELDERVDFRRLHASSAAVWSLLLSAGYLRIAGRRDAGDGGGCDLALTNKEVAVTFDAMVTSWFDDGNDSYSEFCRALLAGDARAMTGYLADLAVACMSSFDTGARPSKTARPERFWHGFVLGLLVELRGRYAVESNRESGYGRYDVMLAPNDGAAGSDPAIILEFKVLDPESGEESLADAVAAAHEQIAARRYAAALEERGIAPARIREYGIAFSGKDVLVG